MVSAPPATGSLREPISPSGLAPPKMPRPDELLFPRQPRQIEDRRKEATQGKILDEFFDQPTLLAISRLVNRGLFDAVEHPISMGKEGGVFRATKGSASVAVKIYRIGNATVRRFPPYALDDLRREVSIRNLRALIPAWTRREHTMLVRMRSAGVRVPEPYGHFRNVLVMEYIGSAEGAAPRLKDALIDDLPGLYDRMVDQIRTMRDVAHLVHGDLSPYNLLYQEGELVIIDVAQAVTAAHPSARALLVRDVGHLADFLRRAGLKVKAADFLARIDAGAPAEGT